MRRVLPFVLAIAGLIAGTAPAAAIVNGAPDWDDHGNVGALVVERLPGAKTRVCSGVLVAPSVFVTAAHCTSYIESLGISRVWVTFDAVFDPVRSSFHAGTMHTHPGYGRSGGASRDIAVVELARPVAIIPAMLPSEGQLEALVRDDKASEAVEVNGRKDIVFTAVGYGSTGAVNLPRAGGPSYPATDPYRRAANTPMKSLSSSMLRTSQQEHKGHGGTCYGDSGAPNFLYGTNTVAAITITGDTTCKSTNVALRLDTPAARDFLREYVQLP